jgi:hypothetical protein
VVGGGHRRPSIRHQVTRPAAAGSVFAMCVMSGPGSKQRADNLVERCREAAARQPTAPLPEAIV